MSVLTWLISGLIIGALAKLVMPGKGPSGLLITTLLGVAGAFIASYIGQVMGFYQPGQPAGWIMSILGAVVLLAIYRAFKKT
jgi:uncharacterized membrane protein YeaQ/YmgE (transglycosylase-associated protein family)